MVIVVLLELGGSAIAVDDTIRGTTEGVLAGLPIDLTPLTCIEKAKARREGLYRGRGIEVDLQLALLPLLRRDDDDPVGSLCPIDSSRGSVLEHLDGLDVSAGEDRTYIIASHHPIDYVEGGGIIHRR